MPRRKNRHPRHQYSFVVQNSLNWFLVASDRKLSTRGRRKTLLFFKLFLEQWAGTPSQTVPYLWLGSDRRGLRPTWSLLPPSGGRQAGGWDTVLGGVLLFKRREEKAPFYSL